MRHLDATLADPAAARRLFVLVTVLLALLLLLAVVLPTAGLFAGLFDRIDRAEQRIVLQERIIARAGTLAAEREALAAADGAGDLLTGSTDALAAADLQARLSRAVQATGARLVSTQGLAPEREGGFVRIGARLTAGAGMAQLRDLLHDLESGRPRLLVRSMRVNTADGLGQWLEISLEVVGFRAAESDPGAEEAP